MDVRRCFIMHKYTIRFLVLILFLFITPPLFAPEDNITIQISVVEICSLGFNSTGTVVLTLGLPTSGGGAITGGIDTTKLLQYSSLVSNGTTRSISINWDAIDTAPAGTSLSLEAANVPAGCGSKTSELTLSATAQNLITSIGGCSTGTGANGVTLTYRFNVISTSQLVAGSSETVTITFTLTDAV
jgi:hypothetical protein